MQNLPHDLVGEEQAPGMDPGSGHHHTKQGQLRDMPELSSISLLIQTSIVILGIILKQLKAKQTAGRRELYSQVWAV
ncbi:hypothetical protein DPMN_168614 [Dreissena polymorpha]|uniref:Uncharacterized protein n=1 Tax=Dreissena polymorpha TaxID=45954 RepID=A0A9D4IXE3_DREPO|nr:hypothetical protein DPMN_168614 [Dreissena polymorpha]